MERDRALAQTRANLGFGERLAVEILLGELVIQLGNLVDQQAAPFVESLFLLFGDGLFDHRFAAILVIREVVVDRDAADEVHDALESAALANGDLHRDGRRAQPLENAVEAELKIRASLSILLMKHKRGTLYLVACRHTVSDWASTPSLPSKTATAPSSTRMERSTSAVKSTWPGVSIRLMV